MNIIFGDARKEIPDSFTVLELDTFKTPNDSRTLVAYCVVEKIPLTEFTTLDAFRKIHADLIVYYKKREWNFCEQAIESLMGKWNNELDTFYSDLLLRVLQLKQTPPDDAWDGSVLKS